MMWGRHLKAVLDGVILQDTVHYFSLAVEQKMLQCFILGLTKGQRRAMGAEGVTKTRGASLYAGFWWKIASASMVEARTTTKKKERTKTATWSVVLRQCELWSQERNRRAASRKNIILVQAISHMDNMSMVATAPFSIKLVYITQTPMRCQLTWKQLLVNQAADT